MTHTYDTPAQVVAGAAGSQALNDTAVVWGFLVGGGLLVFLGFWNWGSVYLREQRGREIQIHEHLFTLLLMMVGMSLVAGGLLAS